MTTPSTASSRNLRVAKPIWISAMQLGPLSYAIDPAVRCEPDLQYRVELDTAHGTATIREAKP